MSASTAYRFEIVHPEGSLERVFSGNTTPDLADLHSIGFIRGGRVFVSAALKAEVEELRENGGVPPNSVYHCTSSRALPLIAEQKALLCSRETLQIYGTVETGEIAHTQAKDWPPRTLDDVYAHRSIGTSYFFGGKSEYPVVFGIQGVDLRDAYGDGLKLGPRVPLDSVVSLTVPNEQLSVTKDWIAENCKPGTLAMSDYAASLLTAMDIKVSDGFAAQ